MASKAVYALLVLVSLTASHIAPAQQDQVHATLKVSQNSAGDLVAHTTGFLNLCAYFTDLPTFSLEDHVITVVQGFFFGGGMCTVNPYGPYDVTVDFGRLPTGTYTVDWNLPNNNIDLSSTYTVTINPGFQIGPGVTGSWYDPVQSGHGFELQVLATQPPQLLATWFVFDTNGQPLWVTGTGPITGNEAVVQVATVSGAGALFPPQFDEQQVYRLPWGSLTFQFSDCNSGTVSWHSDKSEFADGGLPITRLTMPAGLGCP